jgi:hypothetical protein
MLPRRTFPLPVVLAAAVLVASASPAAAQPVGPAPRVTVSDVSPYGYRVRVPIG